MSQLPTKVLTLDLWDTVIRRKCHPDEIKEKTADYLLTNYYDLIHAHYRSVSALTDRRIFCEHQIGEKSKEKGLDDEYEIHYVFHQWLENVFSDYTDYAPFIEELYLFELHSEMEYAYLDPYIIAEVKNIPHQQLAYISDFYAGTEFIDRILAHINCPLQFDRKYVSCEYGYNKRSGRLFDCALKDMEISAEQQCHIGDNAYSDVKIPRDRGICAKQYLPPDEQNARACRENDYTRRKKTEKNTYSFKGLNSSGNISVFFYGFIHWIIESCIQEKITEIYFFTREGEFYKQVFDEIIRNEYVDQHPPKSKVLEVSRLSTFCASLREITLEEMMRIWNQYSIQSIGALFKSLGIPREAVSSFTDKYQIPWEESITYPWQDKRVISLFGDSEFLTEIQMLRDEKKELLMNYLAWKGLKPKKKKKIAIVDIGWRGTIQDNLSYLLPTHEIKGYYVGLIPFLNEQPVNTVKRGYLNGYRQFDLLFKYVMPFEMISNSPNGSTIGYEYKGQQIQAIRKKEKEEDQVYYQYIEKIQHDVIKDIAPISRTTNGGMYIAGSLRAQACNILSNYILYPPRATANAYFSLKHNEEFGIGDYVDKTTVFRPDLFIKACLGKMHRSNLAQFLRNTTWPQGYLVKYHLSFLVRLYNKRYSEDQL